MSSADSYVGPALQMMSGAAPIYEYAVEHTALTRQVPDPITCWWGARADAENAFWSLITLGRKRIVRRIVWAGPWEVDTDELDH